MARIGIIGSEGRMGHALAQAIVAEPVGVDVDHDGGLDPGGAERVDAPAQDLDRLVDGAAHPVVEPLLGQRELEQPVRALGDVDVAGAGLAEDDVRDRLRQLAQLRRDAGPLVRVGDAQLDAALGHLDAALDRGAVVAKHAAHVVEVLDAARTSSAEGRPVELESEFPRPEPLDWAH